jgi:hypothetical protein
MLLKKNRIRFRSGTTLVSSLIAVAIIIIAVIGTSNFRYYTALDSRKATARTESARIALLLCESWRGMQGDLTFNPVTALGSDLTISDNEGPEVPDGFTTQGSYLIILDDNLQDEDEYHISYYTTLSWKDIQPGLRALHVTVAWARQDSGEGGLESADESFSLTIYTLTI